MPQRIGAGPYSLTIAVPAGWAMATDLLPRYTSRQVIGYNPSIGTSLTDISELGVAIVPLPTSAIAMEMVSTSGDDAAAGIGARTVEIHGLDTNWDEVDEIVILNGTTPVNLVGTYRRINNIHVKTVGSGGANAGNITLQADGAGTAYSIIIAGANMTRQCHFTLPTNKTGYIPSWSVGSSGNKPISFYLCAKSDWDDRTLTTVFHLQSIIIQKQGTTYMPLEVPIKIPAMADIKISAQVIGAGTGEGSGQFTVAYTTN